MKLLESSKPLGHSNFTFRLEHRAAGNGCYSTHFFNFKNFDENFTNFMNILSKHFPNAINSKNKQIQMMVPVRNLGDN